MLKNCLKNDSFSFSVLNYHKFRITFLSPPPGLYPGILASILGLSATNSTFSLKIGLSPPPGLWPGMRASTLGFTSFICIFSLKIFKE